MVDRIPYLQPCIDLGWILQNVLCKRTGAPVASQFGNFTIFTDRIMDFNQIVENIPCIVVDLHAEAIDYFYADQNAFRMVPLSVIVYIPLLTRGKSPEDTRIAELKSDVDIKTVFGDLEEVIHSGTAQQGMAHEFFLIGGGGIFYEPFDWEEPIGTRFRVGQINAVARSLIR